MPYNKEEKKQKPKYTVLILPSVQKQLDKLPNNTATRIEDKMMELESEPRPSGCKKLKGRNAYRIRIGDYRAIHDIIDNKLIITVINVAHRKDVYQ